MSRGLRGEAKPLGATVAGRAVLSGPVSLGFLVPGLGRVPGREIVFPESF